MEFRTRCRLIPALFALTFCAVPALAQEEPDPIAGEETPFDPTSGQDPFAQAPGRPGGQPVQPGFPGQGGRPAQPGQPGFGQPGMGFNPMMNPMMMQSPEMAKKMRAIMVLRQMWQLRLTAKDISLLLPPLRELAEAEKNLQARSEKILEDERRALLAADPDGDPPDGSGDLMQRENDLFRIKSDDTWRAIDKSIGRGKANGIRGLLGMGGPPPFNDYGNAPVGGGFGGQGGTPPNMGRFQPRDGGGGFGGEAPYDGGGGLGQTLGGNPARPGPASDPSRRPRQNRGLGGSGDNFPGAQPPGGGGRGGIPPTQQTRNFNPDGMPGMPGRGGMPMMPQMRVSITEFVGLLGEKLAAMRK